MNSGEVFLTPSSFYFPSRAHRNVVSFLFTFPAYVVVVWKLDVASWLPGGAFAMRLAVGAAVILGGLVRTGFSSWEAVTSLGQRLRTGIQVVFHIADNYVIFLAALLLLRFDLVVPPLLTEQDAKVVLAVAYLLLEIATYILYRNRVLHLVSAPAVHSRPDPARWLHTLNDMIEHCEPVDLVNFLAYSFYCTPDLIPESFPRAEVLSWLVDELGVSEVDADDAVTRLEARLGWAVPSAASQPSPASRTRIFGRTEAFMHPHYRPLALVALIALAHWVASSYMRYVLGFALMHPLRHDLKGTLRFFVLHPVRRGGDLPCHDRPLLCFHGFGFGVIPYTFALTFVYLRDRFLRKSHPERRRVIIIPEFLWLGLDPLGGAWAWSNVMDVWRQLIHQPSRRRRASLEGVLRIGRSGDMVLPSMGELVDEIHNVCYWVVKNPSAFTGTLQHILPTADCIDYSSRYQHMTRLRRPASRASIPCLSDPSADFTLDVFAHSYGTAVASAFYRAYRMSVGKVVLGDPICFLVQVTKKVQLCGRRPWQVELLDRPYSNHSSVLGTRRWCEGVEARPALSTRRRLSIGVEWVVDKALLLFYWYVVYRDFGTRWTTARQLKGHEYIDDGSLLSLGPDLMIILGTKDLICPSVALQQFLKKKPHKLVLVTRNTHHGFWLFDYSILKAMTLFFEK